MLDHQGACVFHHQERADEIDAENFSPIVRCLFFQHDPAAADAGIGKDHIDAVILFDAMADDADDGGFVACVGGNRGDGAACVAHHFGGFIDGVFHAVNDDEFGPFGSKQKRARAPDAAARACDDRALA